MIIQLLLAFALLPASAILAGVLLWLLHRREPLEDGPLLRHFLFLLVVAALLGWGLLRMDAVQLRLDPQLRLQRTLEAEPLYATLQRLAPREWDKLAAVLAQRLAQGDTLDAAFVQAQPALMPETTQRLGFAGAEARVAWGRVVVATLRLLRQRNPADCRAVIALQPFDAQVLQGAVSPAEDAAFRQAVVAVYESAGRGMVHGSGEYRSLAASDAVRPEYQLIQDALRERYGDDVMNALAVHAAPRPRPVPVDDTLLCTARIEQLDAMLQKPAPVAAVMLDAALR